MEIHAIMTSRVYVVSPTDTVAHVRNMLVRHKISSLLVVDKDKPIGIITDKDLADAFFASRKPIDSIQAKNIMSKSFVKVKPTTRVENAARVLISKNAHAIIVYDKQIMGIVTKTDFTKYFASYYKGIIKAKDIMEKKVRTIKPQQSIFHALKEMERYGIEQLVVWEPPIYGIISQKDIALSTFGLRPRRIVRASKNKKRKSVVLVPLIVEDIMKTELVKIAPKSDAATAAHLMIKKRVGSVIVSEKNVLNGIITKTDITKYVASK
ncbi:MAG: CBS domain-containing protein [Candidatus Diapherotrites archaeon]|nr:CBS domain-containing protein [Candidatus Diapherotrites archaeon]